MNFTRGFLADQCNQCGKCLSGCHYSSFTPTQAREVMLKITAELQWPPELTGCIRCGKCDYRCPEDARPGSLMLECFEYRRRAEGKIPASMAYAVNGMGAEGWKANFFRDVYKGLGAADRKTLRHWAEPKKSKDLLFIGCTDRMMPAAVEGSRVLSNAAKFGGPDDCCGVWAIQAGLFEEGFRIAERLISRLKQNRFDRLVVGCGHCQKVLTRILPETFNLTPPFPIISIYEYFLEQIESGAARVTRPLSAEAAISDPCFGYENGAAYLDATRRLAAAIGLTVTELPHNREDSLCCGYGGLFNDGRIANVVKAAAIKRKDLAAGGKKQVVSYCPGCHLLIHYFQPGYKSRYLLEDVPTALGDPVAAPFSVFYRRLARPRMAWNLMKVSPSALL
jgi:Fe-S oxidoreductase